MLREQSELKQALVLTHTGSELSSYLDEIQGIEGWTCTFISDWNQLFDLCSKRTFFLVILELGSLKPEDELKHINELIHIQPGCLRFALHGRLSVPNRVAFSECCHRLFPLDCEPKKLAEGIAESSRALKIIGQEKVKNLVGTIKNLPSIPDIYVKLNQELSASTSTARSVAAIIEQDMAMAAKILQLVNSACFILERNVTNLSEAVAILGMREVRDLVLTSKVFDQYPQDDCWESFAFDHIRDRSVLVAGLAREICRTVKAPQEVIDQAFLAALLQDFGMLVFATHDAAGYQRIMQEASDLNQPLYAVEKMRLGVSHTEAGAYLLSLWNISPAVIETVLFHHFPSSSKSNEFSALTAVHVADAILPNVTNVLDCQISSRLSYNYLERLGLEDKINRWQQIALSYKSSHPGCGTADTFS